MLNALAAPNALQDIVLLRLPLRRNENANRLPDEFFAGIPEHALGGSVAGADDAVEILRQDGIVGGFHDSGKAGLRGKLVLVIHSKAGRGGAPGARIRWA